LLVIVVFAAIVYSLFWLLERRRRKRSARRSPIRPVTPLPRALGPDDDVEFLRQLEQRQRRAAHEQQKPTKPAARRDDKPSEDNPAPKDPGQPA